MSNYRTYFWVITLLVLGWASAKAQQAPIDKEYENAIALAQQYAQEGDFNKAEAAYRKAISLAPDNATPAYNMGNLYYNKDKKYNANTNYKKAAEAATTKAEKHKIWHNLGNALLENKQYEGAVEAYKNALRNNPTDDQTRYNLALAKKEHEKNGGGGGNDDKQDDQNNDQDNKEGDKDQNSDGKNEGDENEKEGDKKEGDQNGDQKDDKGKNSEGDKGDGDPKQNGDNKKPQRVEGKMTPQQIKQILEAMENEEQKIQQKVKGKKLKGKRIKTEKDW